MRTGGDTLQTGIKTGVFRFAFSTAATNVPASGLESIAAPSVRPSVRIVSAENCNRAV